MAGDGKSLEALVRQIEELSLPSGFTVTSNRRLFNDDGIPIAEFDVEIAGRIGSADMLWLIECRDREGPAPAAWIEQLVGRRSRFGFNKVMAVSTTGFAPGAVEYAKDEGIELRTVSDMKVEELPGWLGLRQITSHTRAHSLKDARLILADDEEPGRVKALERRLAEVGGDDKFLRAIDGGEVSAAQAFLHAMSGREELHQGLEPNGPGRLVRARVAYPDDKRHYVVDTDAGPVRVREILFVGEVRLKVEQIPFTAIKEYRRDETNEPISQSVSFPVEFQGSKFALEMHNLADTGETHVLLRKLS